MKIFCDFDGTISNNDLLDIIIKEYYGVDKLLDFENELLNNEIEHNEQLYRNFKNIPYNLEEIVEIIKNHENNNVIDDYFNKFYNNSKKNNFDLFIISGGFKQVINKFLPFIDTKNIYANDIYNINRNELDKNSIIDSLKNKDKKELCIYIGDGISDFKVVDNVDILYVKKDSILEKYCKKNNYKCVIFKNFKELNDMIFNKHQMYKLLSPGVVRSHNLVVDSLSYQHIFMHRQDPFHDLYDKVNNKLKSLACDNLEEYITLIVTGSGTSSMDEVISAHVNHGNTLILSNGMFGERWISIGEFYNKDNLYKLENKWGEPFIMNDIINKIKENNINSVVVVHCDTSVGILNNIDEIGKLIYNIDPSINYIVDSVSTFGGIPINMDDSHIDYLVTNPNKALASHMGIGLIIARHEKIKLLESKKCGSFSLNLARHYKYSLNKEVCNSISISSIIGLNSSLEDFFPNKDSIEKNFNKFKKLFNILYDGVKYNKLLDRDISSPCIITIMCPKKGVIDFLRESTFVVYECKGHLLDKGFQVSFFGADGEEDNILKLVELINSY